MSIAPNRTRIILFVFGVAAASGVFAFAVYGLVARAHLATIRTMAALTTGRPPGPVASNGIVAGIVKGVDGAPLRARLSLVVMGDSARQPVPARGRGMRSPMSVTSQPDGQFEIPYVSAGKYWLVAHAEVIGRAPALPVQFWGIREVSSDGRGQVDAPLQMQVGGTVTGRLSLSRQQARGPQPDFSLASLILVPVDSATMAQSTSGNPHARPDATGGFVIPGVPPGRYRLEASVGAPWAIDAADIDGKDAIDVPVDIVSKTASVRANIVVTDGPNDLEGLVQTSSGGPAGLTLVMAFSADPGTWTSVRRSKALRTGVDGRFRLTGLPAGEYLVAAAADLPPEQWYTGPGFTRLAAGAARVRLGGGVRQTVTLQVR